MGHLISENVEIVVFREENNLFAVSEKEKEGNMTGKP